MGHVQMTSVRGGGEGDAKNMTKSDGGEGGLNWVWRHIWSLLQSALTQDEIV